MGNVTGLPGVLKALQAHKKATIQALRANVKDAAIFLLNESNKIVPVDENLLWRSGQVRDVSEPRRVIAFRVEYRTSYAVYVHEDLTKAHGEAYNKKYAAQIAQAASMKGRAGARARKKWFPRKPEEQAKFLERPARERRADIIRIVRGNL